MGLVLSFSNSQSPIPGSPGAHNRGVTLTEAVILAEGLGGIPVGEVRSEPEPMNQITPSSTARAATEPNRSNDRRRTLVPFALITLGIVLFLSGCAPLTHPVSSPRLFNEDRGSLPMSGAMNRQVIL